MILSHCIFPCQYCFIHLGENCLDVLHYLSFFFPSFLFVLMRVSICIHRSLQELSSFMLLSDAQSEILSRPSLPSKEVFVSPPFLSLLFQIMPIFVQYLYYHTVLFHFPLFICQKNLSLSYLSEIKLFHSKGTNTQNIINLFTK